MLDTNPSSPPSPPAEEGVHGGVASLRGETSIEGLLTSERPSGSSLDGGREDGVERINGASKNNGWSIDSEVHVVERE